MVFALGAASRAINLLSSLNHQSALSSAGADSASQDNDVLHTSDGAFKLTINPVDEVLFQPLSITDKLFSAPLSSQLLSALVAIQGGGDTQSQAPKSREDGLKDLFSLLDGNVDGLISKTEFETSLGSGGATIQAADKVFAKLDKDGTDSVSADELTSALGGASKAATPLDDSLKAALTASLADIPFSDNFAQRIIQRNTLAISMLESQIVSVSA